MLFDFFSSRGERRRRRQAFAEIYETNAWGNSESHSGPGSALARASEFRHHFELLSRELGVRTLLDACCGDFHWLSTFELQLHEYIRVDILPALITSNRLQYGCAGRRFIAPDIITDRLPRADLVLCRDGIGHLCDADVIAALRNFKRSGSCWLLTNTFVCHQSQSDIAAGAWRPLNLQLPPSNLPPPEQTIDEQCLGYDGRYRDKRLALWRLASWPLEMKGLA